MYRKFLLIALPFLLVSCLKEQDHDCPPAYQVEVVVGDKNYDNIGDISGVLPVDEGLDFGAYVGRLNWQLQNKSTGQIVDGLNTVIPGSGEKSILFDFSKYPAGRYLFTVYGNADAPFTSAPVGTYSLHPNGTESTDIYRVAEELELSPQNASQRLAMLRTKGALLIQIENLPDSVTKIVQQVYSVYRDLQADGTYATETDVVKSFTSGLHPEAVLFTRLAPSVAGKQSSFRLGLYASDPSSPFRYLSDIQFTLKRNEISAFRITFLPEGGVEVWINTDGSWEEYHEITLD